MIYPHCSDCVLFSELLSTGSQYTNATAQVITWTMNNYHDTDDPRLEKVLAWEAEYLSFIQDYIKHEAHRAGLNITYSSEVSGTHGGVSLSVTF